MNEFGHHFEQYSQFNPACFPLTEVQTFVMSEELAEMASAFGIELGILLESRQHFPFLTDNRDLPADERLRLEIEYNVHRQMISQRFIARLASWRSDNALIRKYHKSRHECTPEAIERAEALIAKRNNRPKRKNKLQDDITLFESCLKGGTFDFAHFDKYALTTQRRIRRFAKSLCERVSSMSEAEMDDPSSSTDLVLLCFSKTKFDCDQYLLALRERRLENDRLNRRAKREDKKKLQ